MLVLVTGITFVVVGLGALVALVFRERKQAQFVYSLGAAAFFALTFALPESSANTVAKLAAGSSTTATYGHVALYVALGVVAYVVYLHLSRARLA